MTPPFLTAPHFTDFPWLTHGFFGRKGGVSTGEFESLNIGLQKGDDPKAVCENRLRIASVLGMRDTPLIFARQKHTNIARVTNAPFDGVPPIADALVTNTPGIIIGVQTADCVPVLYVDPIARVIAAAHAGWKGLADGILKNTLTVMERIGANRAHIIAAIGPCIWQESYEVGEDVKDAFSAWPDLFTPWEGHTTHNKNTFAFNLPLAAYRTLEKAGIRTISSSPTNTYTAPDDYFSYRRATHAGTTHFGVQASLIAINP